MQWFQAFEHFFFKFKQRGGKYMSWRLQRSRSHVVYFSSWLCNLKRSNLINVSVQELLQHRKQYLRVQVTNMRCSLIELFFFFFFFFLINRNRRICKFKQRNCWLDDDRKHGSLLIKCRLCCTICWLNKEGKNTFTYIPKVQWIQWGERSL